MANRLACRSFLGLIAALAGLLACLPAPACPFCTMSGQTLTDDVNQASMVLYGKLANAKPSTNGDFGGTTDLLIEAVVKKHEILGDKVVLTLPRYVPDNDSKVRFLIFCDVFKGKIDPYKGVPVKTNAIVYYLKGAFEMKDKPIVTRLRFFFDWLDNADLEISNDAYKEFGNADYKEFRAMAKELPAEKVAKWLEDPNTPPFRYGLYASMLGHSGSAKHGDVLRKMLDDPEKRVSSGIDGILAGYTLLQPKAGWDYTRAILKDPKKEFMSRYAALRAIRFFFESRPDVLEKKELIAAAALLLDQNDIADLAIEDLRKWKCWEVSNQVLGLMDKPSHNIPIIRRAIMRFALSCPEPKAVEFAKVMRQKDADWVKDVEELLKLETPVK